MLFIHQLVQAVQASRIINNRYKYANFAYNGATEMVFGSSHGKDDGEHNDIHVCFVGLFTIFAMHDNIFFETVPFDGFLIHKLAA